ncbi:cell division protein ZapA (FtsZ GTPase activity inhibitor) [Parabacteroides sp. PF5-5]|uniref:cell division protein ZapA n=1 Tax=unclassified Parabacteroides TaxID=2649774 RepID=UPI002476C797|nr:MULTISPECIES: cell division protein ZapA [unclassified Parabacteroides]MDH6305320.1 cell division protein ZapA (FtsZ GTPase activity inhibitor) [Parabacteroides sp. PH5-39]MDH6316673.1 cell division protein ZapA (FtsZ GTPase activity inhibitor) [Parabacteroides sp. PF5-13]MDH6320147.1 cell division protein ZapA (FtsZ GTPase activity inhibitor) [Parabacteroides sp. PH5-13]MDH6323910.1 cell division protein ZapA (FtsZ GTPase activity inhibitor) [Parabacteroides sp. PH5-8]MDH6327824.1 cell div
MDDNKFLIHVKIAEKPYGLRIERKDEQLVRHAARQIESKMTQYRRVFSTSEVDVKDLLAMVTLQLSIENLRLERKNDTSPFADKIQQLTDELESYLKDSL